MFTVHMAMQYLFEKKEGQHQLQLMLCQRVRDIQSRTDLNFTDTLLLAF